jgi:glycosyltransferase involved in cell wall biosynthesis
MKIAIDARCLTGRFTGDRTYWKSLIHSLAAIDTENEYLLFSRTEIDPTELPTAKNVAAQCIPAKNDRSWTFLALPAAARAARADLLHGQYTMPPQILCSCPYITTVHDVSFQIYPEWFPARDRVLMNLTVPVSMRGASHVITDSESSRRDILRCYRYPDSHVSSILLGLTPGFENAAAGGEAQRAKDRAIIAEKYAITKPFILCLGVLQPRKNLNRLAEAYGKLKAQTGISHSLVLVGKAGWLQGRADIVEAARKTGGSAAAEDVLFPGYAPDEELAAWYRAADLFVHPSLYEGFGIPPLEAMACGTPLVVSNAPALPEITGDVALQPDPMDVDGWVAAMHRAIIDEPLRQEMRVAGPQRAARFSWQDTARQTLNIYRQVAMQRKR